jgi:hypothetical protein
MVGSLQNQLEINMSLKKGAPVKVVRGGVKLGKGTYKGKEEKANGTWHKVDMAKAGDKPDVRSYRESNLTVV